MATLLVVTSTIRTSASADIFDDKTNVAHNNKEANDKDGDNDEISAVMPNPPCVNKYEVANNTPKMSILLISQKISKLAILENLNL